MLLEIWVKLLITNNTGTINMGKIIKLDINSMQSHNMHKISMVKITIIKTQINMELNTQDHMLIISIKCPMFHLSKTPINRLQ